MNSDEQRPLTSNFLDESLFDDLIYGLTRLLNAQKQKDLVQTPSVLHSDSLIIGAERFVTIHSILNSKCNYSQRLQSFLFYFYDMCAMLRQLCLHTFTIKMQPALMAAT